MIEELLFSRQTLQMELPSGFLLPLREEKVGLGAPLAISATLHGLGLFIFIFTIQFYSFMRQSQEPPVKVMEIHIMDQKDLALKGKGNDWGSGPLPDKTLLADAPKAKGPIVSGNTPRVSKSLSSNGKGTAAETVLPKISPKGALFTGTYSAGSGVGREKIYVQAKAARLMAGAKSEANVPGQGLVGVSGEAINLNTRVGGAGNGKGSGNFLGGGEGSVGGGSELKRRGRAILAEYTPVSSDIISEDPAASNVKIPEFSDEFFSIDGPLGRRKILKMKLPQYPRWAEESGVEAQVAVRLTVTPNGRVKSNLYVERTSGFPELDQMILESVKNIRFAPLLPKEIAREEWGIATFNFKLKKAIKARG